MNTTYQMMEEKIETNKDALTSKINKKLYDIIMFLYNNENLFEKNNFEDMMTK